MLPCHDVCRHVHPTVHTRSHIHTHTHAFCSPENTHAGLTVYSVWRASPVSLSLRYQIDSRVARMPSISLTETSLCDSNSQPSSTAAQLSPGNNPIPPTAHNSNLLQQAYWRMVYCNTVKGVTLVQHPFHRACKAEAVFLPNFLMLCPLYCLTQWQSFSEMLLCHLPKKDSYSF